MSFKYQVGQAVEYKPIGRSIELFAVTQRMPQDQGILDLKYRIKSAREGFERCVLECDLNATDKPESMYNFEPSSTHTGGR